MRTLQYATLVFTFFTTFVAVLQSYFKLGEPECAVEGETPITDQEFTQGLKRWTCCLPLALLAPCGRRSR